MGRWSIAQSDSPSLLVKHPTVRRPVSLTNTPQFVDQSVWHTPHSLSPSQVWTMAFCQLLLYPGRPLAVTWPVGPSVFQFVCFFQGKFRFSKWLFPFFQCFPENSGVFSQFFKPFPFFFQFSLVKILFDSIGFRFREAIPWILSVSRSRKPDGPRPGLDDSVYTAILEWKHPAERIGLITASFRPSDPCIYYCGQFKQSQAKEKWAWSRI